MKEIKNINKKFVDTFVTTDNVSTNTPPISNAHVFNSNHNSQNNSEFDDEEDYEADTLLSDAELAEPPLYAVIMYNDDYTPMDFVVLVLMNQFKLSQDEAIQVMMNIHEQGKGVAGIYTKDIAETKASQVNSISRSEGFPLMTQIESIKD